MQDQRRHHFEVLWEYAEENNCVELFQRLVALVLNDHNELIPSVDIDRSISVGINEEVPVENTNKP